MPKRPSWKAITEQHRKENFVGRADQIRAFQENFDGEIPKYMIFSITGEGGVGKSTLLKRFRQKAEEIEANVVICDDRQTAPVEVMGQIAEQLAKLGMKHSSFDERYKKYRELRQQMESDPNAPRSVLDAVGHGVADLALMGLSTVPGVAPFTSRVDTKAAGGVVADLMQYTASRWTNKDEVLLVREPEKVLTPLFVELLDKATEEQRLVLMLDVFERTGKSLSPWLLLFFNSEYGELSSWLTFVLSGRDPLEQHWTAQAGIICHARLEPFDEGETRLYLSNQSITDDGLIKQIYQDTKGLPVLLELLAATNPQPGVPLADISKDAVDRFLLWTPAEMRNVALLAAIPRQFNQDILAVLLGENAPAMFAWLSEQSYIRSDTKRGWFYHEKVRELMLRYQRKLSPAEVEKSQIRLAEHFAALQVRLALPIRKVYENDTWRQYELERVYHLFSAAPEQYWAQVVWAFLPAFYYHWYFAKRLVRLAQQVIDEVKHRRLEQEVVGLGNLVNAYEKDDYPQIIQHLGGLYQSATQNNVALSALVARRGIIYSLMRKFEEAFKDLDQAIALGDLSELVFTMRGILYRGMMKKYIEALKDFDYAIMLNDKFVSAIAGRGDTYRLIEKYDEAIIDYNRAIELDEKSVSAIAGRAATYRLMKRYDQALIDLNRAIELDEKYVWAIASRGQTYHLMERYDEALIDFNRAIELDKNFSWAIASRGETYRLMERYDEALIDSNRAIELDEKSDWVIASRGETYRLMERYDEALIDFNHAIELDGKYVWAIVGRGETYWLMKRYDQALIDFNRAIELDEKFGWAISRRGEIYRLMEKYDEALIDFNCVIELDEKSVWAIASRGDVYRLMKRYDEALIDFNRAIELDGESAWVIDNRGQTYYEMGKYEQALIDFGWMVAQNTEDTEALFMRAEILRRLGRFSESLDDFNRIFILQGDRIDIHHLARRALTFKMMGNNEAAKIDLEKAFSMPCKDTRDHYNRAAAFLVNDQVAEALLEFDLAFVDSAPRDYAATDDLLDSIRELPEYQALLVKYGKS